MQVNNHFNKHKLPYFFSRLQGDFLYYIYTEIFILFWSLVEMFKSYPSYLLKHFIYDVLDNIYPFSSTILLRKKQIESLKECVFEKMDKYNNLKHYK